MIKSISVTNFKSFENLDLEVDKFNVIVGANSAGKSNFIQIFKFLRDIANYGFKNAISMQGGSRYITNSNIGISKDLTLKVSINQDSFIILGSINNKDSTNDKDQNKNDSKEFFSKEYLVVASTDEIIYDFSIHFKKSEKFEVKREQLTVRCELFKIPNEDESLSAAIKKAKKDKSGFVTNITIANVNKKIETDLTIPPGLNINKNDLYITSFPEMYNKMNKDNDYSLLSQGMFPFLMLNPEISRLFREISIYDFDPKLPKTAVSMTGKRELEENGSNLSIVLKSIIDSSKDRKKLISLVKDVLPFVENLNVNNVAGKYLLFNMREVFNQKEYPASLISDGTINVIALITALYFEDHPIIFIEEPERNMHPHLMSKVVDILRNASSKKQIFVTTHNPEVVRCTGLDSLLLIKRDKDGYSKFIKPKENEAEVKNFLENDIGLDDLYINELLG